MSEKLEKYHAERAKINEKLTKLQARSKELDRLITETENTEIVTLMRSQKISIEDFTAYIEAFRNNSGASFDFQKQEEAIDEE